MPPALIVNNIAKSFRVARESAGESDPRRERLSRGWDRFWALRGVSFAVEPGRTLGIIGPNGSGKSTLMKILAGVMQPERGGFEAHGRIGALLELGAGFHPELTAIENVYLNGALLGLGERQVDALLPHIIEFSELEHFMDMPVKHFSSGMTTRLGFAVAMQLAPEILLMDETFATGDAHFMAKTIGHIAAMKARGHTMILVSHNMEMILQLTDHVIWLERGTIRSEGPPREMLAEYRRTQGLGLEAIDRMRSALGLEAAFEGDLPADPAAAPVRIESARLLPGEGAPGGRAGLRADIGIEAGTDGAAHSGEKAGTEAGSPGGKLIDVEMGGAVRLELTLAHGPGAPERVAVETAWVRGDDRFLAQSRTPATLAAGAGPTRLTLRFDNLPLTEAVWRLALALSPLGAGEMAGDIVHENSLSAASRPVYYDRRIDLGAVRVTTPNPFELPVPAAIPNRWML